MTKTPKTMFHYQRKNNEKFTDPVDFVSFYICSLCNYPSLFGLCSVSDFFPEFLIIKIMDS